MNGFCGAKVVSLAGNGRPGDAAPLNAGSEGGGGAEVIGNADAVAGSASPAASVQAPQSIARLLKAANIGQNTTFGEFVLRQSRVAQLID